MPWDQATGRRRETTINERVRIIELSTYSRYEFSPNQGRNRHLPHPSCRNLSMLDVGHHAHLTS
ncbi:hypothetical protein L873DRAFT_1802360, partial [Choiromyces venosus 120613-1]